MEGYRILIVEDHVQSRTTMAEYLRRQEGVALVREAGNGAEALKLLSEEPFEIMITDIIMPQMDGYALLEEMRRRELPSKPQTIVVSALGRDDFVTRAIELGATFYMVKPFDTKEVVARIKAVLRRCTVTTSQTESSAICPAEGSDRRMPHPLRERHTGCKRWTSGWAACSSPLAFPPISKATNSCVRPSKWWWTSRI